MRLNATRLGSIASSRSFGDQLDDLAGQVPSLDLNFAQNKSLIDDYSGTTLVTFTRASSGTYVDSEGVIRTAVTNLLLRSEEFSDAAWVQPAIVSANTEIAPNGTLTADTITSGGGANSVYQNVSVLASTIYTASVYVKLGTMSSSDYKVAVYNNSASNFIAADVTPSQTPNSSGWTRVTYTFTTPVGCTSVRWYPFRNGSAIPLSTVYLWGAQLEQSATVGEYVPTTSTINSAPRFDHDPTTGESLGLLVEEARTNSIRNNTGVGAVAGTPGALPTNWANTSANGITREIVGTGTEDGIAYIDVRFSGTNTLGSTYYQDITFDTGAIAAAQNQSWTQSAYVRLLSGAISGASFSTSAALVIYGTPGFNDNASVSLAGASNARLATQRFSVTRTFTNALTTGASPRLSWSIAIGGTIDFTLRIGLPQLEEGSFPTSYIPTVAATVTRAADVASITGSNFGVTRTNLLARSEEFDDALWAKVASSVTANAVSSPDGTVTADKLIEAASSAWHYLTAPSIAIAAQTYVFSVFAKAAERSVLQIIPNGAVFPVAYVNFDLTAGTVSASSGVDSASITAVGDGWYRCVLVDTATSAASVNAGYFTIQNSPTASRASSYTGDGTSGLYIWGAQLEVGSAVTPYIQSPSVFTSRASSGTYVGGNGLIQTATTNEARYDHDPVSLIGKGLLLEEARTNLILQSEDFGTTWTTTNYVLTTNAIASPSGTTTADKLARDTVNASVQVTQNVTCVANTAYNFSCFVKAAELSKVGLREGSGTGNYVTFDLSTATVVSTSGATGTITPFANGWYRVTMQMTTGAAQTTYGCRIIPLPDTYTSGNPLFSFAGDGTSGLYLWGAQLEAGAFATSYIPTTTATVTRAADISTSVATSVFESSWYRQDSGSWYCSATSLVFDSNERGLFGIDTGSFGRGYHAAANSPTRIRTRRRDATNTIATDATVSAGTSARVALVATSTEQATTYNGGAVITNATALTLDPITDLRIGYHNITGAPDNRYLCGCLSRLTYWPTRLGNEVLQRITQ